MITEKITIKPENLRTKFLEFVQTVDDGAIRIEDANIIVCGGRGLGKAENFKLLEDLADALGGVVAGSRKTVDAGWMPVAQQVGQTGKTVNPDIFVSVGISGAIQHQVGMENLVRSSLSTTIQKLLYLKSQPTASLATSSRLFQR